ncbi:MAG TPA: hypothetical protein VGH65_11360, partial [Verrucomicrobiaceae bacterium]
MGSAFAFHFATVRFQTTDQLAPLHALNKSKIARYTAAWESPCGIGPAVLDQKLNGIMKTIH